MVRIRKAVKEDMVAVHALITELAIYEREPNAVIISPEDFFILQKYNVDSLNWEMNKNYYSKRPKMLASIYRRVQDSIEKRIDSLKNLKKR